MSDWPTNILNMFKMLDNQSNMLDHVLDDHATAVSNKINIKRNIGGSKVGWNVGFVWPALKLHR